MSVINSRCKTKGLELVSNVYFKFIQNNLHINRYCEN